MKGYFVWASFLLLLAPFVSASYISLQTTSSINDTTGNITVIHLGDEPAYQVQIVSRLQERKYEGQIRDYLSVGEGVSLQFPLNYTAKRPGMYPLLVTLYYQDGNGYLFSALHAKMVKYILSTRSEIVLELGDVDIKDVVSIPVTVKNFGETAKTVDLSLFISDEFVVKEHNRSIVVRPKQSETTDFSVENFGARAGSKYVFYAVAEYDENDEHFGALDPGTLRVLLEKNRFFDTKGILIALAIIVLVIIVLQFTRKK